MALSKTMAEREKDWRIGPIVYQVFVDRWVPPADPKAKEAFYKAPRTFNEWPKQTRAPKRGDFVPEVGYWAHELDFWGGDLAGTTSKLGYLETLGVDVLYLQPITEAFSNHKYDTSDYLNIDPAYGTLADFERLVSNVHAKGMKIVLDGVFNHVGCRSPLFQEALEKPNSARREWFYFGKEYGAHGYRGWAGTPSLPELKHECCALRNYCWSGENSVVATWLKRGIDGWRLDVASELGLEYLKELTEAAHRHKPGSLVVGECWVWPSTWTQVMDGMLSLHMGFCIHGLVKGTFSGPAAVASISRLIQESGIEQVLRSWIILGNHDTPRLIHMVGGDGKRYGFAMALMFVLPGCPLIYYGDELATPGGEDPENRACMRWELVEKGHEALDWVKLLIQVRKKHRALRIGDFDPLPAAKLMAFLRVTDKLWESVLVVANATDQPVTEMLPLPLPSLLGWTLWTDALAKYEVRNQAGVVEVEVPPKTVRVLWLSDAEGEGKAMLQYKRMSDALPLTAPAPAYNKAPSCFSSFTQQGCIIG